MRIAWRLLLPVILAVLLTGCGSHLSGGAPAPFNSNLGSSVLPPPPPVGTTIQQTKVENTQLDLLWSIDSSANMAAPQVTLSQSVTNMINYLAAQNWDFHIAVVSTDAYLADPALANYNPSNAGLSQFKDGGATLTGVFDITPQTANLMTTMANNIQIGELGNNDERSFSSFRTALSSPLNAGFLRSTSFLAVILFSDEDDFSGDNRGADILPDHGYTDPNLDSVNTYVSYLDALTGTTGNARRYNVSSINVQDSTCLASRQTISPSAIVGLRAQQLVQSTGGVLGSFCDANYVTDLANMMTLWATLATQISINYPPNPSTFTITNNGNNISQDASNGWTYNSSLQAIQFHGSSIPRYGDSVLVTYTQ